MVIQYQMVSHENIHIVSIDRQIYIYRERCIEIVKYLCTYIHMHIYLYICKSYENNVINLKECKDGHMKGF